MYLYTVEPLYSGHALERTPLYSGHLFQEPIVSSYGKTLIFRTSLQRTPRSSGHPFQDPMVSAIERFHCTFHFTSVQTYCQKHLDSFQFDTIFQFFISIYTTGLSYTLVKKIQFIHFTSVWRAKPRNWLQIFDSQLCELSLGIYTIDTEQIKV